MPQAKPINLQSPFERLRENVQDPYVAIIQEKLINYLKLRISIMEIAWQSLLIITERRLTK